MLDPISQRLFLAGPPAPVCLMYHATPEDISLSQWDIPLTQFKQQLKLLKTNGWETRPVSQIMHPAPAKTAFISFDDGYANNYAAFQTLKEFGFVATWFIVTNTIGKQSVWEDNKHAQRTMLNTEQIQNMAKAGIEIGSHTSSHAKLTHLSYDEYVAELASSKRILENIVNQPVTSCAYPYGLYSQAIRNGAESAGYKQACTTHSGFGCVDNDALQIRRVSIYSHDSLSTFARKLVFGDNVAGYGKTAGYLCKRLLNRFS
ncbi:MAG: polysaccharide deacetylase family protein [Porticoccaceae bacterium]|nr:polysaccharide deacetylase family protein [Porticoccaceae bacterium]